MIVPFYFISVFSGLLAFIVFLTILTVDIVALLSRKSCRQFNNACKQYSEEASIIISNFNGKRLLQSCIPSVLKAAEYDGMNHEVILVDDASNDSSVQYVKENFPSIRILALSTNLRFAEANNVAVKMAKNDIVIFLNNDMVVEKEFIRPLLSHFRNPHVFAVSARIKMEPRYVGGYLANETGITKAKLVNGFLETWQEEKELQKSEEIFYFSGGSSAVSKKKFFELGGFDPVFSPFYYEDTDISYRAKKKKWKILVEPASIVHHKFRATNNERNFHKSYIKLILKRNYILFNWINIHDLNMIIRHFVHLTSRLFYQAPKKRDYGFTAGYLAALLKLPQVIIRRYKAQSKNHVSDTEIFDKY